MTRSAQIVVALRLVVPLSIFRWPLRGGILSAALDATDVILVDAFARELGEPRGFGATYPRLDKWLDTFYLAIEAAESTRWAEPLARRTSLALFAYRLMGVSLFEATGVRRLLLVFPNVFENFYWFVLIARRTRPSRVPTRLGRMAIVVGLLALPKLAQEWVLHSAKLHPWQWLRGRFAVWSSERRSTVWLFRGRAA